MEATTSPIAYGLDTSTPIRSKKPHAAGCIGLKVRLLNGTDALTTVTHGLVDPPEVSKKTPADSIIRQMLHKAKERLVRYLPARVRDDEWFIRARGRLGINPIGREVFAAVSNRRVCVQPVLFNRDS